MSMQNRTHTTLRIVVMIISSIALVELLVHLIFQLSNAEAWISETTRIIIDVVSLTSASSFAVFYWVFKPFKLAEQQALLNSALQAAVKEANEERARTASILAAIGDAISIQDTDFKVLYQNTAHKNIIGEHVGECCYRAYEKQEQRCDGCGLAMSFKDGGVHTVERSAPTDHGMIQVEITSSPVRDSSGKIIAGVEVVRDITERKRVERELKSREAQLAESQRIAHIGSWERNIRTDEVQWSDEIYRLFGFDPQTKPNSQSVLDVIHPDDRERFSTAAREAVSAGTPYSVDFRIRRANGTEAVIHSRGEVIRDASGNPAFLRGTAQEITERKQWEQALKNQWHLAEAAIQNSAVATFVLDAEHRVVVWNKACEVLTGHPAASIIGTTDQWRPFYKQNRSTLADIIIDENFKDLPDLYPEYSRSELAPGGLHAEGWFYNLNGKDRYIIFDASPILDTRGKLLLSIETLQDITERKLAEDLIKESEKRYHSLFDNAHVMIQSVSPDGHFLFVNPAWRKALGYSQEDLLTLTLLDVLDESCKPRCQDLFKRVMSGESVAFFEVKFVAKNGKAVDIEGNASASVVDGKVISTQSILRDVTERNKLEQQVFLAKQDWEETFNTITDMVTVHDKDYTIIRANKAAEKILGLPLLDISKVKCFNYYHGSACPPNGCPSCQSLITGKPSTSEMYEPHLKKFIEIRAIPRLDKNGEIEGLIHVVRDISERKKLEEQLFQAQKMEAVGQLAGGVAHDFNNILTAILGDVYILGMKLGAQSPLTQYVDDIRTSSEKAAALTQSLLAFSRKQVINPKPMDLNATVKKIQKLVARIVSEDISLKIVQAVTELTVMADSGQLEQVMVNLITNARDSMPQGGTLTIATTLKQIDDAYIAKYGFGKVGTYALLSVADTGTGMDEKTRERIFEPFFTTKEVGKGTGLGLSIVYGIIKQHNGFIDCFSAPGAGTAFNIYLPLVDETHKAEDRIGTTVPDRGKEYILLAEDDARVRKTTKAIIEEFGYRVIEAMDGEDAVRKFNENRDAIQLLVMDVIMPGKNGKEAYEEIKAIKPKVKVLFLSGYSNDIIHKKGILDESLNFLSKPASPVALLSKIREVLDQ